MFRDIEARRHQIVERLRIVTAELQSHFRLAKGHVGGIAAIPPVNQQTYVSLCWAAEKLRELDGPRAIETASEADALLSAKDLADRFSVPYDALRKRLDRWRAKNKGGDWIEVDTSENLDPNAPRYLYRLSAIYPLIASMKRPSKKK
ncbi:MAG TPA: hypothetical protein VMY37_28710 [Thermoguttaceae bacterium]|nr:hypothetical protein [Thermoguttaceae bacterium]